MRSKLKKKPLSPNVTAKMVKINLSGGGIVSSVGVLAYAHLSGMNSGLTATAVPYNSLRQEMKKTTSQITFIRVLAYLSTGLKIRV